MSEDTWLSAMSTLLKWIAYGLVMPMVVFTIVPYSNPALNPFFFASIAIASFTDGYVLEGVRTLLDRGQHWERHFVPALVNLHVGIVLTILGIFYSLSVPEAVGLAVLLVGLLYCANQIDRAIWHPVDL